MNITRRIKKMRNDYVIRQAENTVLPVFEASEIVRYRVSLAGRVQHQGLRLEIERFAKRLCLTGWIKNKTDGSVDMELQGQQNKILFVLDFLHALVRIKIKDDQRFPIEPDPTESSFEIL